MTRNSQAIFRVDFSLRREVFFVVIGALLGALPYTFGFLPFFS
jgi:hypothetical protein